MWVRINSYIHAFDFLYFQEHLVTEKKEKPESMNAFELISRSQGFSLENMFEKQKVIKSFFKKNLCLNNKANNINPFFFQ